MIKYYKYHALGNDYIVINPSECPIALSSKRIKHICHRNFGIGSDGILVGPINSDNKISLKIYNPDGSEAEKSGNGIRIFSRYLIDKGYIKTNDFELDTLGGKVFVQKLDDEGNNIRVAMGRLLFNSSNIPVLGEKREVVDELIDFNNHPYKVTCVTIGNPHCVIPVPKVSADLVRFLGPIVENHPLFPNRINMQLLEIIDRNNIKIEIWERGAGYTLASGSSSCAAAGAAYRLGLVDRQITVHMAGGNIDITIDDDWMVSMTGSVNSVSEGIIAPQFYQELINMK